MLHVDGLDKPQGTRLARYSGAENLFWSRRQTHISLCATAQRQKEATVERGLSGARFIEQASSVDQIRGVLPFGEPAIDFSKDAPGVPPLALLAPKAHRCAKFV